MLIMTRRHRKVELEVLNREFRLMGVGNLMIDSDAFGCLKL